MPTQRMRILQLRAARGWTLEKTARVFLIDLQTYYQQRYVASGYLTGDARELVDALERWLDGHICHIDAHLKACVRK